MPSLKSLSLALAALSVIAITPTAAQAISVECMLKDGSSCTVSNDPVDSTSCMCADESGTGTSGANDWADFDEEMLLEVCTSELALCSVAGTDGEATSVGTIGTDSTSDSGDDTEGDATSAATSASTSDSSGGGGTTGGDESSSEGGVTGNTGGGPSTDPAATSSGSASGGDDTTTGTDPAPTGESSGGTGLSGEDPSGCSVAPHGGESGALLALFGLVLGLRRRPR